jgi:HNH endonuclease
MAGVTLAPDPFAYPTEPHCRRHGPAGYTDYQSYRPWLEDEFVFRCIYCLKRMVWAPTDVWSVDHIIPQEEDERLECIYDNLVLACQFCNRMKSDNRVADPCLVAYGQCLHVSSDGAIVAMNKVGERLLRVLRLNEPRYQQWRARRMRELHALALCDPEGYEQVMGFPAELTDLSKHKPKSNSRPDGVNHSWFAKRQRGELPKIY